MNHRRRLLLALTLVAAALLTVTASNIHYTTSARPPAPSSSAACWVIRTRRGTATETPGGLGCPHEKDGGRCDRVSKSHATCAMESALADLSKPKGLP
jgi:hypothetical protein